MTYAYFRRCLFHKRHTCNDAVAQKVDNLRTLGVAILPGFPGPVQTLRGITVPWNMHQIAFELKDQFGKAVLSPSIFFFDGHSKVVVGSLW